MVKTLSDTDNDAMHKNNDVTTTQLMKTDGLYSTFEHSVKHSWQWYEEPNFLPKKKKIEEEERRRRANCV